MIQTLDNTISNVARQIYNVFQNSYKIEADLIGVSDFPPLSRTADKIQNSKTAFYGFIEDDELAAVIEVTEEDDCIEIDSLTVDPKHFRKGIAGKLISFVLDKRSFSRAIVETAVVNAPAIKLYEKYGFIEFKRWTPSHGIPKIALHIEKTE